jgi:hypothetical protein
VLPVNPSSCKRRGISQELDSARSRSFACAQDDILGTFFNKLPGWKYVRCLRRAIMAGLSRAAVDTYESFF